MSYLQTIVVIYQLVGNITIINELYYVFSRHELSKFVNQFG